MTFDEIVRQAYLENVDRGDMELLKVIEKVFYNASGDGGGDSEDYSGIAFFDNSATFADVQAAISDGKLPILNYYNMGTPAYFYCCEHSSVSIDFISFGGLVKYQLRWSSNGNKQLSAYTLVSNQSPHFYGNPTAATPDENDSSTKIATTSFVNRAVNKAIDDIAISGISEAVKQALLLLARKVVYHDEDGSTYETLYEALYPPLNVSSIEATWNPPVGYTVYSTDSLDSLKTYLTVVATYDDESTETLEDNEYVLSGTLIAGTSTITVTYGGETTTFNVTVVANALEYITAVFTQGDVVIYENDTLETLVPLLTVTATYTNSDVVTIAYPNYTLSGTLAEGTSTVTVTYSNKTTTFTVDVSAIWSYSISDLTKQNGAMVGTNAANCGVALATTTNYRRSFFVTSGEVSVALQANNNITAQTSRYYPIKIPTSAVKLTVTIAPSTQYVACYVYKLEDGVYSQYTTTGDSGYMQTTHVKNFTASANLYLLITTKYNSSGNSYPTEPTGLTILFE